MHKKRRCAFWHTFFFFIKAASLLCGDTPSARLRASKVFASQTEGDIIPRLPLVFYLSPETAQSSNFPRAAAMRRQASRMFSSLVA